MSTDETCFKSPSQGRTKIRGNRKTEKSGAMKKNKSQVLT